MAKYNILIDTDNSPDNEAGIQDAAADYSLDKGVPFTNEEFLQQVVQLQVNSLGKAYAESQAKIIAVKFVNADLPTRTAAEAVLAAVSVDVTPIP